jgi:hypothetical protein
MVRTSSAMGLLSLLQVFAREADLSKDSQNAAAESAPAPKADRRTA